MLGFNMAIACLLDRIEDGDYRKCGLGAEKNFLEASSVTLTATFAIEERYFSFGHEGPASELRDEYIFVTGLEIHFEKLMTGHF